MNNNLMDTPEVSEVLDSVVVMTVAWVPTKEAPDVCVFMQLNRVAC